MMFDEYSQWSEDQCKMERAKREGKPVNFYTRTPEMVEMHKRDEDPRVTIGTTLRQKDFEFVKKHNLKYNDLLILGIQEVKKQMKEAGINVLE